MKKILALVLMQTGFICSYAQSKVEGYEFWFNDDFTNRITTTVTPAQQLFITQNIPTSGLLNGTNILNLRSFDNSGRYSSILSHFFYKTPVSETGATPVLSAYEYWINNDYNNAVVVNTNSLQYLNINELIPVTSLKTGVHNFSIRFKDNANKWSSIVSHLFYKTPQELVLINQITAYRYWIDNDFNNAVLKALSPGQQINVMDNLDMTKIPKGGHQIQFQFKDSQGKWSVVLADSINKTPLPVADFSYTITSALCDSTIVAFTNASIDGDEYLWNFGDGKTATDVNPTHIYKLPGSYNVRLTIKDNITLADSTVVKNIQIKGNTKADSEVTACDRYVSPSGKYTFTSSGVYHDTIPNQWGCDSLLTIGLTIKYSPDNSVTKNGLVLTANAGGVAYQWLDCGNSFAQMAGKTDQSFTATENGSYAVVVSQNGCADTSVCHTINSVGIIENSFGHGIVLYPNPTDGELTIDLGKVYDEMMVVISDANGKVIRTLNYKNLSKIELDVFEAHGIYFVSLVYKSQKAVMKVIKNQGFR